MSFDPQRVDLSVVFVTRNEEERIGDCIATTIASVEEARRDGVLRTVEYILVDSASTDRTVEVASQFPIRIVQLEPEWPLSCGAGCFVGLQHARGTYTAIINGDMTIDRHYFSRTLPFMTLEVAGVCGVATEHLPGRTTIERMVRRYSTVPDLQGSLPNEVKDHPGGYSTGTILLRTDAAIAVGSYNPFFRAAEDMDLRYRLIRAGWKVLNVPVHQGLHFWGSEHAPLGVFDYFGTIYRNSVGLGQMARFNLSRDPWVARRAAAPVLSARIVLQGLEGLGLTCLAILHILAVGTLLPLIMIPIGLDFVLLTNVLRGARRRHLPPKDVAFSEILAPPVFALMRMAGFLRGFSAVPHGPREYPPGPRILKA